MPGKELINITNWNHTKMKSLRGLNRYRLERLKRQHRERVKRGAAKAVIYLLIFGFFYCIGRLGF